MTTLSNNPTKADEIDFWGSFVKSLPKSSYLYCMFENSLSEITAMIRNDFGYDPMSGMVKRREELKREIAAMVGQVCANDAKLEQQGADIKERTRRLSVLQSSMDNLRAEARRLAIG